METKTATPPALQDAKRVAHRSGMSRSLLYQLVSEARFPAPVIQRPRFTRWRASDVDAWIDNPAAWLDKGKATQQ